MPNTLNDWIKEFYPINARNVKGGNKELLEHSLRKWRGATKENTEAYDCEYINYTIVPNYALSEMKDQGHLFIDFGYNTCALCQAHKRVSDIFAGTGYDCNKCIIVQSGHPACPTEESVYDKSRNDPAPMIALLEKLLQETNENQP